MVLLLYESTLLLESVGAWLKRVKTLIGGCEFLRVLEFQRSGFYAHKSRSTSGF